MRTALENFLNDASPDVAASLYKASECFIDGDPTYERVAIGHLTKLQALKAFIRGERAEIGQRDYVGETPRVRHAWVAVVDVPQDDFDRPSWLLKEVEPTHEAAMPVTYIEEDRPW